MPLHFYTSAIAAAVVVAADAVAVFPLLFLFLLLLLPLLLPLLLAQLSPVSVCPSPPHPLPAPRCQRLLQVQQKVLERQKNLLLQMREQLPHLQKGRDLQETGMLIVRRRVQALFVLLLLVLLVLLLLVLLCDVAVC